MVGAKGLNTWLAFLGTMVKVTAVRSTPEPEWLVCETARGDYSQTPPWNQSLEELMKGVKGNGLDEKKRTLLTRLFLAGHWGPFEHPVITFGIEGMTRVTLAQLTRHRIASFDIQSQRYVKMGSHGDDYEVPPSITAEEIVSRKGGKRKLDLSPEIRMEFFEHAIDVAHDAYELLISTGVPEEDARYVLPNAQKIHGTMTVNARSLMHIIALRSFGDAQWEIRDLVNQMLEIAKEWMPITFSLFEQKLMKQRTTIAP